MVDKVKHFPYHKIEEIADENARPVLGITRLTKSYTITAQQYLESNYQSRQKSGNCIILYRGYELDNVEVVGGFVRVHYFDATQSGSPSMEYSVNTGIRDVPMWLNAIKFTVYEVEHVNHNGAPMEGRPKVLSNTDLEAIASIYADTTPGVWDMWNAQFLMTLGVEENNAGQKYLDVETWNADTHFMCASHTWIPIMIGHIDTLMQIIHMQAEQLESTQYLLKNSDLHKYLVNTMLILDLVAEEFTEAELDNMSDSILMDMIHERQEARLMKSGEWFRRMNNAESELARLQDYIRRLGYNPSDDLPSLKP